MSKGPHNPVAIQTVEILQRRWLSKNAFEIELSRPPSLDFEPGQTVRFIHESFERYYSLLSTPQDSTLAICVCHIPQGKFSPILAKAEIGHRLKLTGPHGYFTFKPSSRRPVFVATGTGIAPFVSFARSGITEFTLLHQAVSVDDLYYQSYLHKTTSKYFSCLSEAPITATSLPNLFCGKTSECIRKNLCPGSYDFYLCGAREMISDVTLLVDELYPQSRIYTEVFY